VKLHESVEIDATPESVWQVIADLSRYGEWNPFVVAAESTLKPGEPIRMRVRIFQRFTQPQTETILENQPGRRLCYGLDGGSSGAIRSHRCHEIERLADGRSLYASRFELTGWLAPAVEGLLGRRLARGFAANTASLKQRAEAMSRTLLADAKPARRS
jgi:hypothetical protein